MNDEPERRAIHVFDIDLETGEVLVQELHAVQKAQAKLGRTSILSVELSRVLKKLERLEKADRRKDRDSGVDG